MLYSLDSRFILFILYSLDPWCLGVMLFIMLNKLYPFDRNEGKELMYHKQMKKDYHLQKDIDAKVSATVKDLIDKLLEPVEADRPDIWTICKHPFFPIAHQEADEEVKMAKEALAKNK